MSDFLIRCQWPSFQWPLVMLTWNEREMLIAELERSSESGLTFTALPPISKGMLKALRDWELRGYR